jgi:hypothetical protein
LVLLPAVKLLIFPLPLAAKPIAMLLFVQVYVVPDKELLKLNAPVDEPAQKV